MKTTTTTGVHVRVRMGWSGETESNTWQKYDVELEQEDLLRVFRENDLPETLHERLPTKVCFQLLQNEAESLLLSKLRLLGYPEATADARQSQLVQSTDFILTAIKAQLSAA